MNNLKTRLLSTLLLPVLFSCGALQDAPPRNSELIVTYEGKEVHRAGSRFKSYQEMRAIADSGEQLYIIFAARWCESCNFLFRALEQSGHKKFVNYVDVDEPWANSLAAHFKISGVPTMIVVDKDSNIENRFTGPSDIVMHLIINVETKN